MDNSPRRATFTRLRCCERERTNQRPAHCWPSQLHVMDRSRLLSVARGDAPADLVLRGGRLLNVFNGEIETGDIAIVDGLIAGLAADYNGAEIVDLQGAYVAPGLIDAHVHIESALCTPPQFMRAVVPRGVTTVITDPHEIANVCGTAGVEFMLDASEGLPLSVFVMVPSCVPATPLATAGAALDANDLASLAFRHPRVIGLAEVMNFPGVINDDPAVRAKTQAFAGKPIDGHCPNVRGKSLNAYVAAGIGSDHEAFTLDEAKEKLARGLYVLVREATNARNLHDLLPLINAKTNRRICFCTDDRQPADLLGVGGIDYMLREAIAWGVDPIDALRCCTLNTAEWFGLRDRGAIAPGRRADLFVFDDLQKPAARKVYLGGQPSSSWHGRLAPDSVEHGPGARATRSACNVSVDESTYRIPAKSSRVRVIGSVEDQLVTHAARADLLPQGGYLESDVAQDVLKMAVLERHRGTGNIGLGFIQGFGLKRGAIAGTVAHDHHNLVVIGVDDTSMRAAARAVQQMDGGLCVAVGENVVATLALPVAGLMSDSPIETVRDQYNALISAARDCGAVMKDPFMAMSFMALEVIPSLKLTDRGLVDVETFEIVSLYV